MKRTNGFTLIETLVVIFLMGIILVGGGGLFFNIMKGASKAEVEKEVKQNGNYAMAIMERMIKNSATSGIILCDPNFLIVQSVDGGKTKFQLNIDKIASSSGEPLYDNHLYLTGDNVKVTSLTFACVRKPLASPDVKDIRRVEISFSLTPAGGSKEAPETYAEINFQTSVSLRNFEE